MSSSQVEIESIADRNLNLPQRGRWLVAATVPGATGPRENDWSQFVVYQSLPREIAEAAVQQQRFVSPFNFHRLSWIKPSFLWMMHRSNWGRLDDCVLEICVKKEAILEFLAQSISSKYESSGVKKREWDEFMQHFSEWERWNGLDV